MQLLTNEQLADIRDREWQIGPSDVRLLLAHIDAQQATITKAAALAEQLLNATPIAAWSDEECEMLAELCDVLDPIEAESAVDEARA